MKKTFKQEYLQFLKKFEVVPRTPIENMMKNISSNDMIKQHVLYHPSAH